MFGLFLIHQISLHAEEMCTVNKVCCLSFIYFLNTYLLIYLAVLGLSCSMWDLVP